MPPLVLCQGASGRPRLGLPLIRQVNAFTERTPGGPTPEVRTSRPGLTLKWTLGSGPILRQAQLPGVFSGSTFSISAGELYQDNTALGAVAFSQYPRMAAANGQLAIVSGGALSVYAAGVLTPIRFFDDGVSPLPPFSGVAVLYDIFVFPIQGSNQFFFSSVGDATTINADNFSAAQTNPTPIVEVAVLAEELYFFKSLATEIWDFNGALTAPFALSQGRTYARGTSSQGSVVLSDNALFWIGEDLVVYRSGPVPQRVSTPLVEDLLNTGAAQSAYNIAYAFNMEGHAWVVINIPGVNQTWAFDNQTKEWSQWGSMNPQLENPELWLAQTAAGQTDATGQAYGPVVAGSAVDGRVWAVDVLNRTDDGHAVRVIVSAVHYISGGRLRCGNVSLHCVRGQATVNIPLPKVQLRFSDDGGQTWCGWIEGDFASKPGSYKFKSTWRGLGTMQQPGRNFEFAVADAVNVTIEGASFNEARV